MDSTAMMQADRGNRMNTGKNLMVKIFIMIFALSVSTAVIPCNVMNTYGLFGEIQSSNVCEDGKSEIGEIAFRKLTQFQQTKGCNIINIWFAVVVLIVIIKALLYGRQLPRSDTIVTLKVRMDH